MTTQAAELNRRLAQEALEKRVQAAEPVLTLRSSASIDEELIDRQIAYVLSFMREKGQHREADDFARETGMPRVIAR